MRTVNDWTLEELHAYCKNTLCSECIFNRAINTKYMSEYECQIAVAPIEWKLDKFEQRRIQKVEDVTKTAEDTINERNFI